MSKKRDTLTRTIEAINAEYAQLCMQLGDALMREQMAKQEAAALWPKLYKLNEEAIQAKRSSTSDSEKP